MPFLNKKIETMSTSELKKIQANKLKKLISYSFKYCKPYRKLMEKMSINSTDIQSLEDISHLPIMDKNYLLANYPYNLLTVNKKNIYKTFLSGGTTGKPIATYYNRDDYESVVEAGMRLFPAAGIKEKNNFYFGLPIGSHITLAIYEAASRMGLHPLPAHFRGQNPKKQLQLLQNFKIDSMEIAPSGPKGSLQDLIEHDEDGYFEENVQIVMYTGGKLSEEAYDFLEDINITVLPSYGSTEIGGIAYRSSKCNLPRGNMHIFSDLTLVEIVDEEGNKLKPGEKGLILVTPLGLQGANGRAMPIIRYLIGDEANLTNKKCSCGRSSQILTIPDRVKDIKRLEMGCASEI